MWPDIEVKNYINRVSCVRSEQAKVLKSERETKFKFKEKSATQRNLNRFKFSNPNKCRGTRNV